jgi:muramoyltetrapeptide carboxypeptidase
VIKANRISRGDTIGIVSPSGPVKKEVLIRSISTLEEMGFKVKMGQHVLDRKDYLAGTDSNRAGDINSMFADDSVKGIFCVRGGYGSTRILDRLDYRLIKRNPKVFMGYSDITAIHIALARKVGLVTFHGPMVAEMTEKFPEYNKAYMHKALFSGTGPGEIENPPGESPIRVLNPGTAEGPVIGGNLSLICSTIGTEYEIDTAGCIFFVEEIGEPPYKIDRMLNHLRMAGKFKDVKGIIFGQWTGCKDKKNPEHSVDRVLEEIALGQNKPCLSNLMIGHGRYNITIPLGCRAVIENGRLFITESGVI